MAAPAVVVPSAHIIELGQHRDDEKALAFARKQKHAMQHPEWRLAEDENVDWSKCHGTVLDASYSALPSLGPIASAAPAFNRLIVLCLRESGLVDIELLRRCTMLVHLDLSSNEIVHLVGGDFWASFGELLVLLLHGNKVTEWRAVDGLGKAPKLAYLTLFFNPVCKKNMYRPFTTNCCESLRGLDLHAVSDEEVVEGAKFCNASRFRTCSRALALPQPLFKGLTEVDFVSTKQERWATEGRVVEHGQHPLRDAPSSDALVLASVLRRVQLLRKFHARNSPVVIGQRQIRRYLRRRFGSAAAIKIQTRVRRWIVEVRAVAALKDILRERGELYLVQEMMTPMQLRSLTWFQRRIAGHFRFKVVISCARILERFIQKVATRFAAFVEKIEVAQVGGIVAMQDQSGELAAAVARALVVTTPGLTWIEAAELTGTMVTILPDCRCLRQCSYVDMPDWPVFEKDVDTDGIFVTRSVAGRVSRTPGLTSNSSSTHVLTTPAPPRPFSGLRDPRPRSRVRNRPGIFGSQRVRQCKLSRRIAPPVRSLPRAAAEARARGTLGARADAHEQLWVFRPQKARMLARVLCTLRYGSVGKPSVPFILERQLVRCASATRIQAAWRGHVLRWVLLDTLASCVIVGRAGVCIQRWWRYQRGLSARLGLCRRLWALASAVWSPVMYIELDVFHALTRGWQWDGGDESVLFTFRDGDRVAAVKRPIDTLSCAVDSEMNPRFGKIGNKAAPSNPGAPRGGRRSIGRELPMWALDSVVQHVPLSEVNPSQVLNQTGALLTVDVKAKQVIWPLAPAATAATEPVEDGGLQNSTEASPGQPGENCGASSGSFSTAIRLASARSEEVCDEARPFGAQQGEDLVESGYPLDLGTKARGEVELLELTFSCAPEARARAVLLALATEEPGARPSRPVAQLMTLEMLRRAAAGEPGHAAPILRTPAQGFRRGDAVEVSLFRISEGHGGGWFPATVDWKSSYGSMYKVTLENGLVEHDVPESSIRPRDLTGKEPALVQMSHLPSRWQRSARSILTPADRLDLELLRRSLPTTSPAGTSPGDRLVQLLSGDEDPGLQAGVGTSPDERRQLDGLNGRGLALIKSGPISPGSPVGRPGLAQMGQAPPPRWASSQTMTAARTAGGLAAEALEKVARAADKADKAAIASTWVPGNRFRAGLEKLVHLATHEAQDAVGKEQLSARRDTVSRARQAERAEPSPRERLERLRAAEAAIFRHESDEIRERAAFERAIYAHELKTNAVEAREYMRASQRQTTEALEAELATKMKDSKKREAEAEGERRRSLEKRRSDVETAKARVAQGREGRAKQALSLAESRAFTANASQLARLVGKHATVSCKVQTKKGLRQWVKGQKAHKEDMRRRMLKRVQELQERKRTEATRQRRALAARSRARAAMDEAVIRHRVGQAAPPGDNLTEDVLHVMRPRSRPQQGAGSGLDYHDFGPVCDESSGDARIGCSDIMQPPRSVKAGSPMGGMRLAAPAPAPGGGDGGVRGGAVPSKPDAPRMRYREQKRNRRLYANDAGKTVVVLASIPTVAREARPTGPRPTTKSSRPTMSPERDTRKASPDKTVLPWPLGRRSW